MYVYRWSTRTRCKSRIESGARARKVGGVSGGEGRGGATAK